MAKDQIPLNVTNTSPTYFFVVGAAKAGTTSLYDLLKAHPEVFVPAVKEPHFYADVASENKADYKKPEPGKTYHTKVIRNRVDYESLFKDATKAKAIGDFSPSYLWDENAAKRIYEDHPNAKIVVVLRDPIERAYSHYLMDVRDGLQTEQNFYKALRNDAKTTPKIWGGKSHLYAELGMYGKQLQRYSCFPSNQLQIFVFESFFSNLSEKANTLCEFLDINPMDVETLIDTKAKNTFAAPKNKLSASILSWNRKLQGLGNALPEGLKKHMKKSLLTETVSKPEMDLDARRFLTEKYRTDIAALEKQYQLDLSSWKASFAE